MESLTKGNSGVDQQTSTDKSIPSVGVKFVLGKIIQKTFNEERLRESKSKKPETWNDGEKKRSFEGAHEDLC